MAKKSAAADYDGEQHLINGVESIRIKDTTQGECAGAFTSLENLKKNPPKDDGYVSALLVLITSVEIALKGVCSAQEATKTLNEIAVKIHTQLTEKAGDIEELKKRMQEIATSIVGVRVALEDAETKLATNVAQYTEEIRALSVARNGILLWEIAKYAHQKRQTKNAAPASIYSDDFYSDPHGYRMCARVYLNGDGVGKNTHLSVFFSIKRGKYDDILKWPFDLRVTFTLMNQNGGEHLSDAFKPDPSNSSFQKPTTEINIASGCPMFVPLSDMQTKGYLKNDKIWIKVTVGQ